MKHAVHVSAADTQGGWKFTLYLLIINVPFGIVTALVARAIIGEKV